MAEIKLRDYQQAGVDECRVALIKYRRVLFQSPTGSGKGVVLGTMASLSAKKGNKILIACHRIEIVKQNVRQAERMGLPSSVITPKQRRVPESQCTVAMAQTLRRRIEKPEWVEFLKSVSFLIIDEAHVSDFTFLFDYISDTCFVCGFSATPCRSGSQPQLAFEYNALVTGVSIKELIKKGYLCRCKLYSLDAPKMDDVDWDYGRGDYALGQMANKFKSKARYIGAVDNYEKLIMGKKTIVFCCSSEQTIEVTKAFNERGVKAKYLLSNSFDEDSEYSDERSKLLKDFEDGEFDVLVNLGCAVAGMDIPSIEAVMLMYATTSVSKYLQSIGRSARIAPNKNGIFYCLDFGCNYERLGRYEDDRSWGLWHNTGQGGGVAPTKECPQCHKLVAIQYQDCPFCEYHWPTQKEVYQVELQEIVETKDSEAQETVEQYVARRKLEGWSNNRILVDICIKNAEDKKKAFDRAVQVLRTNHGDKISPSYWYSFKKYVLSKVRIPEGDNTNKLL